MKGYAILPLLVLGLSACDKQGEPPVDHGSNRKVAVKPKGSDPAPAEPGEGKKVERRQAASRPAIVKKPAQPETPVAKAVPGQKGFVISPHSKGMVDVRDIPPGTLVQDPTAPDGEKRMFRVPEPN